MSKQKDWNTENSESLHHIPFQLINYGLTVVKISVLGSILAETVVTMVNSCNSVFK